MNAVGQLDDVFARVAIIVLRHTGIRIGELLDLEICHLVDYGHNGTWKLRVPLGKLHNERSVPVDDHVEALDEWLGQRQSQRARPHPRDGHLADFIFVDRVDGSGPPASSEGFRDAITAAGLSGPDGRPKSPRSDETHLGDRTGQRRHVDPCC